jgi:anaphase-promoting complex subunit 4
METNAFASLAVLSLPSACRLLRSACCPDKDLIVLISRLGGKDRMSLWKIQGSKKWEVDVGSAEHSSEEIVGLAWSPDGKRVNCLPSFSDLWWWLPAQSIAVAHDPPRITLHSVQDGHEEGVLPVKSPDNGHRRSYKITGIWWFKDERLVTKASIPDIFRRNGIIVRISCHKTNCYFVLKCKEDRNSSLDPQNFTTSRSSSRGLPKAHVSFP